MSTAALRQNRTFRQSQVLDPTQARDASRAGTLKRQRASNDREAGRPRERRFPWRYADAVSPSTGKSSGQTREDLERRGAEMCLLGLRMDARKVAIRFCGAPQTKRPM